MKKFFTCVLIFVLCLFAAGCGMGFSGDAEMVSAAITYDEISQKYYFEITYDDGTIKKVQADGVTELGKEGPQGDAGNGIADIVTVKDDDLGVTTVTVKFTDEEKEPVSFQIPHGVYISHVTLNEADETHASPYLTFAFSDGRVPKEIILPQAKDGRGIKSIELIEIKDEKTGVITGAKLRVTFDDDSEPTEFDVPMANGVKNVTTKADEKDPTKYVLVISYTNGLTEEVKFDKPSEPSNWISGVEQPGGSIGKNGDYYFDTAAKVIYIKENGSWKEVISFKTVDTTHSVTFDANGGAFDGGSTIKIYRGIKHGDYLSSGDDGISAPPVPVKDGYRFDGWYTVKDLNLYVGQEHVYSRFGDLTPVNKDLTLYARWIEEK